MTLDEAIIHAEEKAKEHGRKLKIYECINEEFIVSGKSMSEERWQIIDKKC